MTVVDGTQPGPDQLASRGNPATRSLLLDAGRTVLAEKSIFDANVEDFVRAAGVARGTFYIYFADKFHLLKDLTSELVSQTASSRSEQLERITDPFERLERRFYLTLSPWREHAGVYRSMFQLSMLRSDFHEMRSEIQRPLLESLQRDIEAEIRSGLGRPINSRVAAVAISRQVELLAMEWFGLQSPPYEDATIEDTARQLAVLWYHALYYDGDAVK